MAYTLDMYNAVNDRHGATFLSPEKEAELEGQDPTPEDFSILQESVGALGHGAFESLSGLASTLTLGAVDLGNPMDRFAPETMFGSFVSGASQFILPFLAAGPLGAAVGNSARLGAAAEQGVRGAKTAQTFAKWIGGGVGSSAREVSLIRSATQRGDFGAAAARSFWTATGRGAVKGAIADFVATNEGDPNFSNFLKENTALQGPVMELLATQEDEWAMITKFKAMVEGAVIGTAIDGLTVGFMTGRAYHKAIQDGLAPEEAAERAVKAGSNAEKLIQDNKVDDLDRQFDAIKDNVPKGAEARTVLEDGTEQTAKKGVPIWEVLGQTEKDYQDAIARGGFAVDEEQARKLIPKNWEWFSDESGHLYARPQSNAVAYEELEGIMTHTRLYDYYDVTDRASLKELYDEHYEFLDDTTREYVAYALNELDTANIAGNPRNLSAKELMDAGLRRRMANMTQFVDIDEGSTMLFRAMERVRDTRVPYDGLPVRSLEDAADRAVRAVKRLNGTNPTRSFLDWVKSSDGAPEEVLRYADMANVGHLWSVTLMRNFDRDIQHIMQGAELSFQDFSRLGTQLKMISTIQGRAQSIKRAFGQGLGSFKATFDSGALERAANQEMFKPLDILERVTENTFDPREARGLLENLHRHLQSSDPAQNLHTAMEFLQSSFSKKSLAVMQEFHINALLSSVGTQVVSFGSGLGMTMIRPLEVTLGAGILGTAGVLADNPGMREAALNAATKEYRTVKHMMSSFFDNFQVMRQLGFDNVWAKGTKREGAHFNAMKTLAAGKGGVAEMTAKVLSLPSAGLEWGDNYLKTLTGRARFRAAVETDVLRDVNSTARVEEMLQTVERNRGDFEARAQALIDIRDSEIPVASEDEELLSAYDDHEQLQAALAQRRHERAVKAGEIGDDAGAEQYLQLEKQALDKAKTSRIRSENLGDLARYTNPELKGMMSAEVDGILRGKETTFQTAIDGTAFTDTAARALTAIGQKHPLMRLFIPFIRTPYNIAVYGFDRTIGGVLGGAMEGFDRLGRSMNLAGPANKASMRKFQRLLYSDNPTEKAQAMFNLVNSVGAIGAITYLATTRESTAAGHELPKITGSGPSNPDAKKMLQEAGWQPFSVLINGKYYSYSRMDPIATMLGLVVDASEWGAEALDDDSNGTFSTVMMSLAVGMQSTMFEKSYMQGLANIFDAGSSPDTGVERLFGNLAGSFVPAAIAHGERVVSPEMSEIRGILDRARSRVPGLSDKLPVRRNLLGEPVSMDAPLREFFVPIRITEVSDDKVSSELARFAYGFSEPGAKRGGVDLLDDRFADRRGVLAYDRYTELVGKVKLRGLSLRQALRKEISSPEYRRIDPGIGPEGERSPRIDRINSILRQFRAKAFDELLRERNDLKRASEEAERNRASRRRGGLTL